MRGHHRGESTFRSRPKRISHVTAASDRDLV